MRVFVRIKKSGVYQIVNEVNGKYYVGASIDIPVRWRKWRYNFKKPMTYRSLLHAAVIKYRIENFTFIILEECEPDKLEEREQHYIDTLKPLYNTQKKARLNSEDVRKKIAKSLMVINTLEKFIKNAQKVHGDRYDYSEFDFLSPVTKGRIICKEHGGFDQTPRSHMYGYGCKECGFVATGNGLRSSLAVFLMEAHKVHGSRYDYSQFEYITSKTKGTIVCKEHGAFEQSPEVHVQMKCECPLCGFVKKGLSKKKNAAKAFAIKAAKMHDDRYDYSLFRYISVHDKGQIICKKHGVFLQKPVKHLSGQGCPDCRYS